MTCPLRHVHPQGLGIENGGMNCHSSPSEITASSNCFTGFWFYTGNYLDSLTPLH
jgi:hypothetical protein